MQDCPIRILILEDNRHYLELLKIFLKKAKHLHFQIIPCQTLTLALEKLTQELIDVILADLFLPDSSGLDTFRQLHAQFAQIPIIILSGLDNEEMAVAALQEGAQDYLVKGDFDENLLIRAIRYGIERQHLRLNLERQTQCLLDSEMRLHSIIASYTDAILIINRTGVILFANPAAESLFKRPVEQLIGEMFGFPILVDNSAELEILYSSGGSILAEIHLVEIKWDEKPAYLASLRDITARKTAEAAMQKLNEELEMRVSARTAELEQANSHLQSLEIHLRHALSQEKELNALKSRIISTVSHEYRTPLTTILLSAELLEAYRHKWNDHKQLKHLRRIQQMVQHLTTLVNDVLFINTMESDNLKFNPVPLDAIDLVQNILEDFNLTLTPKHRLNLKTIGDFHQLYLDTKLLRPILTNLLANAIKYSPDGGTVEIKLSRSKQDINFQIRDEGIGIPSEYHQRLFESFSRADNVGTIPGTGLGLSIVKKCVDLHQGQIIMNSQVGVGTTFMVSLPLTHSHG